MKNIKLWLSQLLVIAFFVAAFLVVEGGVQGRLYWGFLRERMFPTLQVVSGFFTDQKFKLRGSEAPKNKIVLVEIDSEALANYGRWPWHRDITAKLFSNIFDAGAKVVGADIL